MTQPTVSIESVSPELAALWLERNTHNRKTRDNHTQGLVTAMKNGEWRLTPDCIAFDVHGVLLNGQHRLEVAVRTGQPITVGVMRGLPAEAQDVMDRGARRSLADALTLSGEKSTVLLAGALGWLERFNTGGMRSTNIALSIPAGRALLAREPRIRASVRAVGHLRVKGPPTVFAMLHYVFSEISQTDADAFFDVLSTGLGLTATDPRYHLRNQLEADYGKPGRGSQGWKIAALTIKAWNAYRDGEEVRQLSYRAGGASPEAFPVPH